MSDFDVIVIGTGVAGQTVAEELLAEGWSVAVVDRREYGGTCLLRGCEAKKVLFAAAEVVERAAAQRRKGPKGELVLDWPDLIAFKRGFTDPVPRSIEDWLSDAGATTLHGEACFVGPDALSVAGDTCSARHIVVAAGAEPTQLGIEGESLMTTSEGFMATERLPGRIVFVGGGYIAFEFAHIAAAAGAHVTICHRGAQVLRGFEPELADMLAGTYRETGIDVRTNAGVRGVERQDEALAVRLEDGRRLLCDMVVHAAGRTPALAALRLEAGDVRFGPHGIEVDDRMRSVTNPSVRAAGDCADRGLPLTPVGIIQARVIARSLLGEDDAAYDPEITPSVVFSDPPLAMVGLTGSRARERGIETRGDVVDRTSWAPERRVGARVSAARVLVDRDSDLIVGAHLLGHHADEVINVFAAAMKGGLTAREMKSMAWAYPTGAWDIVYLV
jgi:glutathione reductase (NADPH)